MTQDFIADTDEGHLKRALGLPSLVLFGLVYMVPLTVFTTYGIVTETSEILSTRSSCRIKMKF